MTHYRPNEPSAYRPVPGPPVNPSLEEPAMTTTETRPSVEMIMDALERLVGYITDDVPHLPAGSAYAVLHARAIIARFNGATTVCIECGEPRPDDDRVANGMKCGPCAYGDTEGATK